MIRSPEYKLILWHPETELGPELYDLTSDPAENNNIYGTAKADDIQAELVKLITDYRKDTGDDQWDMKGPIGMFEPERLKWKPIDGPPEKESTSGTAVIEREAGKKPGNLGGKRGAKGKRRPN